MKAARHQHYVPQLYLRYFGDSKDRLWEYDKRSDRCTRRAIKEVAAERDYYSFEDANGEINHQVDANLQKLEAEAAGPLKHLVEGSALSAQDRFQISTLIALLYVRTPTFRRTAAELMASGIGALHGCMVSDEEKIENFLRVRESAKSGSIDREKFKKAISAENLSIGISKHVGIGLMSIFPNIGELLFGMQWSLLDAPVGKFFITSDNPVVLESLVPPEPVGFASPQAVVSFPLSPAICWVGSWVPGAPERQLADPETVDDFNRLRVASAERFFFADRQDADIVDMARQHPDRPQMFERVGHAKPFPYREVRVPRRWDPPNSR